MRGKMYNKNLKRFSCALIVGLVVCLLQGPLFVCASSLNVKIVRVGYYENALFQEGAGEDEVKAGYAYEYYMKLSEYTGWRYEYVYGNFSDLYQQLVDGDIDMLAGLAYREERADLIGYPEDAMGSETYNLIKLAGNQEINSNPDSINGHSIGVLESAVSNALDAYLISHDLDAKIVYYNDTEKLIDGFESGEVDLLATEGAGTVFRKNYDVISTFGLSDYYICVSNNNPELLKELNEAQTSLFNDEPYFRSSLSSKYFAQSVSMQALSTIEREWLDSHESITIGYLNNYLPYCDTDSNGEVNGVVKDVIPAIFSSLNLTEIDINYVGFDNYEDMIAAIDDGIVDAAFPVGGGMYYLEQNGIYQTHPLVSVSTELIYKNVVINPNVATFGVNKSNKMQYYYIQSNYPGADIVYYDNTEECLKAVLKGEVDCTTLNGLRASEILKNYDYSGLSSRQLSAKDDRGIGVKIGNEGLLRLFNRGVHIIGDDYAGNNSYKYVDGLYAYSIKDWLNDHFIIIINTCIVIVILIILAFVLRVRSQKKANAVLRNSAANQKLLIENIAGSLKTPIGEIYDASQMMEEESGNEKFIKKSISKIASSSHDALWTLNEIIDSNLLEKKKMTLKQDKVNIHDLVKEVERNMLPKAEKKNITLTVSVNDIINKDVIADKARLMQVLESVLLNAINYTQNGGKVNFTATEKKCINPCSAEFVFTVKDNGIGMSQEFQKIAFEPYTKEEMAQEQNGNRPGLGLAVASKLVGLMNGSINLKSEKGKGSEFSVKVLCKINYSA